MHRVANHGFILSDRRSCKGWVLSVSPRYERYRLNRSPEKEQANETNHTSDTREQRLRKPGGRAEKKRNPAKKPGKETNEKGNTKGFTPYHP